MKQFLRNNGLSLVLVAIFVFLMAGHAATGWHAYNDEQREHADAVVSFTEYVRSGHFWESVFENWESEFLQMGAYVLLTVCLFQKGSAESNDPGEKSSPPARPTKDSPGPVRRGGWRRKIYEHSLSLALLGLFLISFIGHMLGGVKMHNEEKRQHGEPLITVGEYLGSSQFWFESFQNWQSEFLAVLAIVVLSIWLREKDSPESKEVSAPHSATGG